MASRPKERKTKMGKTKRRVPKRAPQANSDNNLPFKKRKFSVPPSSTLATGYRESSASPSPLVMAGNNSSFVSDIQDTMPSVSPALPILSNNVESATPSIYPASSLSSQETLTNNVTVHPDENINMVQCFLFSDSKTLEPLCVPVPSNETEPFRYESTWHSLLCATDFLSLGTSEQWSFISNPALQRTQDEDENQPPLASLHRWPASFYNNLTPSTSVLPLESAGVQSNPVPADVPLSAEVSTHPPSRIAALSVCKQPPLWILSTDGQSDSTQAGQSNFENMFLQSTDPLSTEIEFLSVNHSLGASKLPSFEVLQHDLNGTNDEDIIRGGANHPGYETVVKTERLDEHDFLIEDDVKSWVQPERASDDTQATSAVVLKFLVDTLKELLEHYIVESKRTQRPLVDAQFAESLSEIITLSGTSFNRQLNSPSEVNRANMGTKKKLKRKRSKKNQNYAYIDTHYNLRRERTKQVPKVSYDINQPSTSGTQSVYKEYDTDETSSGDDSS